MGGKKVLLKKEFVVHFSDSQLELKKKKLISNHLPQSYQIQWLQLTQISLTVGPCF